MNSGYQNEKARSCFVAPWSSQEAIGSRSSMAGKKFLLQVQVQAANPLFCHACHDFVWGAASSLEDRISMVFSRQVRTDLGKLQSDIKCYCSTGA